MASGWPADYAPKLTPAHEEAIAKLLTKLPTASRGQLLKLAKIWGVKGVAEQLAAVTKENLATLADEKADEVKRIEAAKQVIEFRPGRRRSARASCSMLFPRELRRNSRAVFLKRLVAVALSRSARLLSQNCRICLPPAERARCSSS